MNIRLIQKWDMISFCTLGQVWPRAHTKKGYVYFSLNLSTILDTKPASIADWDSSGLQNELGALLPWKWGDIKYIFVLACKDSILSDTSMWDVLPLTPILTLNNGANSIKNLQDALTEDALAIGFPPDAATQLNERAPLFCRSENPNESQTQRFDQFLAYTSTRETPTPQALKLSFIFRIAANQLYDYNWLIAAPIMPAFENEEREPDPTSGLYRDSNGVWWLKYKKPLSTSRQVTAFIPPVVVWENKKANDPEPVLAPATWVTLDSNSLYGEDWTVRLEDRVATAFDLPQRLIDSFRDAWNESADFRGNVSISAVRWALVAALRDQADVGLRQAPAETTLFGELLDNCRKTAKITPPDWAQSSNKGFDEKKYNVYESAFADSVKAYNQMPLRVWRDLLQESLTSSINTSPVVHDQERLFREEDFDREIGEWESLHSQLSSDSTIRTVVIAQWSKAVSELLKIGSPKLSRTSEWIHSRIIFTSTDSFLPFDTGYCYIVFPSAGQPDKENKAYGSFQIVFSNKSGGINTAEITLDITQQETCTLILKRDGKEIARVDNETQPIHSFCQIYREHGNSDFTLKVFIAKSTKDELNWTELTKASDPVTLDSHYDVVTVEQVAPTNTGVMMMGAPYGIPANTLLTWPPKHESEFLLAKVFWTTLATTVATEWLTEEFPIRRRLAHESIGWMWRDILSGGQDQIPDHFTSRLLDYVSQRFIPRLLVPRAPSQWSPRVDELWPWRDPSALNHSASPGLVMLNYIRTFAQTYARDVLWPREKRQKSKTPGGAVYEGDDSPTQKPHSLVIQTSDITSSSSTPAANDDDPRRHISGLGMLVRMRIPGSKDYSSWRCLNLARIVVNVNKNKEYPVSEMSVVPLRSGYQNQMGRVIITYDNHPLAAENPAYRYWKDVKLKGMYHDGLTAWMSQRIETDDAPDNRFTFQLVRDPAHYKYWSSLPYLSFGDELEVAVFTIGNSGALPETLANGDPRELGDPQDVKPESTLKVRYLRRVPIGQPRWKHDADKQPPRLPAIPTSVAPLAREIYVSEPPHALTHYFSELVYFRNDNGQGELFLSDHTWTLHLDDLVFTSVTKLHFRFMKDDTLAFMQGYVQVTTLADKLTVKVDIEGSEVSWIAAGFVPRAFSLQIHCEPIGGDLFTYLAQVSLKWQGSLCWEDPKRIYCNPNTNNENSVYLALSADISGKGSVLVAPPRFSINDVLVDPPRTDAPLLLLAPSDWTAYPYYSFSFDILPPSVDIWTHDRWLAREEKCGKNHTAVRARRRDTLAEWHYQSELADTSNGAAQITVADPAIGMPSSSEDAFCVLELVPVMKATVEHPSGSEYPEPLPFKAVVKTNQYPLEPHQPSHIVINYSADPDPKPLNIVGTTATITVAPGEVWELRIYAAVRASYFGVNITKDSSVEQRFPMSFAKGKRLYIHPKNEQLYCLLAPQRLLIEGAMALQDDLQQRLWNSTSVEFSGNRVRVRWNRADRKFDLLADVDVLHQMWRWDGRPVDLFPFNQPNSDEPPNRDDIPSSNRLLWDAIGFGNRSQGDHVSTSMRTGMMLKEWIVYEQSKEHDLRALYMRFALRAYSRYRGITPDTPVLAARSIPDDNSSVISDIWHRLFVPNRVTKRPDPPVLKLVVPLTQSASSAVGPHGLEKCHAGVAAGLLVVLRQPWFESAGLAESLVAELATANYTDPSNDVSTFYQQFGPDPIQTKDPWDHKSYVSFNLRGPIGQTFDTDTSAPLFINTSFIAELPINIAEQANWSFAKLSFRRRFLPEAGDSYPVSTWVTKILEPGESEKYGPYNNMVGKGSWAVTITDIAHVVTEALADSDAHPELKLVLSSNANKLIVYVTPFKRENSESVKVVIWPDTLKKVELRVVFTLDSIPLDANEKRNWHVCVWAQTGQGIWTAWGEALWHSTGNSLSVEPTVFNTNDASVSLGYRPPVWCLQLQSDATPPVWTQLLQSSNVVWTASPSTPNKATARYVDLLCLRWNNHQLAFYEKSETDLNQNVLVRYGLSPDALRWAYSSTWFVITRLITDASGHPAELYASVAVQDSSGILQLVEGGVLNASQAYRVRAVDIQERMTTIGSQHEERLSFEFEVPILETAGKVYPVWFPPLYPSDFPSKLLINLYLPNSPNKPFSFSLGPSGNENGIMLSDLNTAKPKVDWADLAEVLRAVHVIAGHDGLSVAAETGTLHIRVELYGERRSGTKILPPWIMGPGFWRRVFPDSSAEAGREQDAFCRISRISPPIDFVSESSSYHIIAGQHPRQQATSSKSTSLITLVVYRRLDDRTKGARNASRLARSLHTRRRNALHSSLDGDGQAVVLDWGFTDDVKPHELVTLSIGTVAAVALSHTVFPALKSLAKRLLERGLDVAVTNAIQSIIGRLRPKQKSREISDVIIELKDGTTVSVKSPDQGGQLLIKWAAGKVETIKMSSKPQARSNAGVRKAARRGGKSQPRRSRHGR